MELEWEDPPVPEAPFFTRDMYEKYSLAPSIMELWASLQSPEESANIKEELDAGAAKASCSPTKEAPAEIKDDSNISYDSDDLCADNDVAEDCKDTIKAKKKKRKNEVDIAYPEPRLPFPCMSTLSSHEQKMYVGILMSKKPVDPSQRLHAQVNTEVTQFMRYLQDVSKICAADYSFISQGALQYTEDVFRCCLECIKTFPQLYQIREMTSLTGGTFNPGLTLTFEKQLLIMGNVDITDHMLVSADTQLASDYQSVSSENPPAKKAKDMHAVISNDCNAEKLCSRYEPHVCLTRDALVRLLDNHGPDFVEQWELPVRIKVNPGKGSIQKKTVYIDSPLLKTELTVRERSHIYHEESLKLSLTRNGNRNVFHLMTELPVNEQQLLLENSQRNLVSNESDGLGFEMDITDLETFGETTSTRTSKWQNKQDTCVKSDTFTSSSPLRKTKKSSGPLVGTSSNLQEEMSSSSTDPITEETTQPAASEVNVPNTKQLVHDSAQESDEALTNTGDSDDEKLVIDDSLSPAVTPKTQLKSDPTTPVRESDAVPLASSSPEKASMRKRQPTRAKESADQLSEILRMQTAMFSSANDKAKCPTVSQETTSTSQCTGPSVHSHPVSLVKPCVSSYLERNQSADTCAAPPPHGSAPVVHIGNTEQKKLLSQDLQAGAEDEHDYEAPEKGNLLYKLYSLQDLLLMVRSSVALTHTRKVGSQNQHVPVHILPKLEYQLSYGVECFTGSEACQLWTESALHSTTVSYIAHINAHTSKVFLRRRLPDDWKQNILCGFKPAKSLNILHHLLKKLTGFEEGQYLITHKSGEPFVTLLKATDGKVSRGAYNLQQVHSSIPQPPASGPVPWIPVDPSVVLPFHKKHGRVPCTFPPRSPLDAAKDGASQANNHGGRQAQNNPNARANKKNKQKKRKVKRNKYMKKLLQKSL